MSQIEERVKRPRTRLREYGAFKADMSILATYKMVSVQPDREQEQSVQETSSVRAHRRIGAIQKYKLTHPAPVPEVAALANEVGEPGARRDGMAVLQFPSMPPPSLEEGEGRNTPAAPITMKQVKRKKRLSVALRIGVTVLLFVFLFKSFSWSTMAQALTHIQYGKMLLGVIVGTFGIVISCYQWRSLLLSEQIGYDLAELIDLYFVGIAFSHFLPTGMGGDVVKAMQVGRKANNSSGSASAVLMCRITGFMGMLLVALPVLLMRHQRFNTTIVLWFSILCLLVGGMLGGAMFAAMLLPRVLKGKWLNNRLLAPVMKMGNALKKTVKRPVPMAIAVVYGAVFWVGSCLNYYAYGIALGIHAPFSFYLVAIPFVSLITFLPISINGFGLREGAFVYIFATIHTASASALLLALFMDAQALLFGVVGGYIYLRMGNTSAGKGQIRKQNIA